jgi:Ser/Thr protein kinase RdoA (MazF antagonist)
VPLCFLGWGYFLHDLAPLLGNLRLAERIQAATTGFLDGYMRVRSLPVEVDRYLPLLMTARHAASLTWLAAQTEASRE